MEQGRNIRILRALYDRHGVRLTIMWILLNNATTVSDLSDRLGVDQSAVSHHLQILKRVGLVTGQRVHKNIYYRLTSGTGFATTVEGLQILGNTKKNER